MDARRRPFWSRWFASLPAALRDALAEYKSDRYPLYGIVKERDREFTADELERFKRLDDAFSYAPKLSKPCRVWRGMIRYTSRDGIQPWVPPVAGAEKTFHPWTSVSLLEEPAATEAYTAITNRLDDDYSVLMEISLPIGQRYIYMEIAKPAPTHEAELLLPRGTRYRVEAFEPLTRFSTLAHRRPGPRAFRLQAEVLSAASRR
jgi:hypothetical protein